jgi:hypothetical protein
MSYPAPSPAFPVDEPTPRSSTIYPDGVPPLSDPSNHTKLGLSPGLSKEIENDRFGWDEPQDPPTLAEDDSPSTRAASPAPRESAEDEKPISWDGPDDPENPHNWSARLRWFYTTVSILMTLNV